MWPDDLELEVDVLIVGGGPAATWAALSARAAGVEVVLVDKGFCGTTGVAAAAGMTHWLVPPGDRKAAAEQRRALGGGLTDPEYLAATMADAWQLYPQVAAAVGYPASGWFADVLGDHQLIHGPVYLREMRRRVRKAGVRILDHAPALGLITDADGGVRGAHGLLRQQGRHWRVAASSVVLATGGVTLKSGALGSHVNTGDGHLMAAEAGATLSGMEFSNYYGLVPAGTSMDKNAYFRTATFTDADGTVIPGGADDVVGVTTGHAALLRAATRGPLHAVLDRAPAGQRRDMRAHLPHLFVVFDRLGIDPFTDRFEVEFIYEGTVRGSGGVHTVDVTCWTGVPGLWVAGDLASREPIVGASSGAGAPNSAWTIASGTRAGRAAARNALARRGAKADPTTADRIAPGARSTPVGQWRAMQRAVQAEVLPLERSAFRTAASLADSTRRLDGLWADVAAMATGSGRALAAARETAAMLASARWAVCAASARTETRGMHRRDDYPRLDPAQQERILLSGVEHITLTRKKVG